MRLDHSSRHPSGINRRKAVLLVATLILGIAATLNLFPTLSLEALQTQATELVALVQEHYVAAVLLFIALYALTAALSIPVDVVLTITGGYVFGSAFGTLYASVGATLGAVLAFLGTRYLLQDYVHAKVGHHLERFHVQVARQGFRYLLGLRLIPFIPFTLLNLLAGLSRMPLRTFIIATMLGILPCSFLLAYTGEHAATIRSTADVFSPGILLAFTALGILALIPSLLGSWEPRTVLSSAHRSKSSLSACTALPTKGEMNF